MGVSLSTVEYWRHCLRIGSSPSTSPQHIPLFISDSKNEKSKKRKKNDWDDWKWEWKTDEILVWNLFVILESSGHFYHSKVEGLKVVRPLITNWEIFGRNSGGFGQSPFVSIILSCLCLSALFWPHTTPPPPPNSTISFPVQFDDPLKPLIYYITSKCQIEENRDACIIYVVVECSHFNYGLNTQRTTIFSKSYELCENVDVFSIEAIIEMIIESNINVDDDDDGDGDVRCC